MNLQSIKYLSALAKHCHFGKAAKMCFVSQPTLSMQIKKLEDQLGVQLLERNNKSVRLTPFGVLIAQHADNILQQVDAIKETAKGAKDPFKDQLKIGIIPTAAPYLLPRVLLKLRKTFPDLSYLLLEKQTKYLLEDLKQGSLDAVIVALPIDDTQLTALEFFKEEFLLAVPNNHPWTQEKTIKEQDLQGEQLLLLDDGHCLRDQALSLCYKLNASETENFRATSLETLRHIIANGSGITLMPKLAQQKNDGISYMSFSGSKPFRTLGLVWRKTSVKTLVFHTLAKTMDEILAKESL